MLIRPLVVVVRDARAVWLISRDVSTSTLISRVTDAAMMQSQRASPADAFSLAAYVTRPLNCTTADVMPSLPRLSLFDAHPAWPRLR